MATSKIKSQLINTIGKSLKEYSDLSGVKREVDELRFKEEYQGRIIDCMVGEVDDNYIETPETDVSMVKLEYSKEGLVKIPSIKGKTILVDKDGNVTDTPGEGCRLVSVGEEENNKLIILSKNRNLFNSEEFYNDWKSKASNYIYKENLNGEDVFKIMDGSLLWGKDKGYKVRVEKGKSYKLSMKVKTITGTTNNVIVVRNGTKSVVGFHVWEEGYFYERYGTFVAEEDYIYICSGYNGHIYFYIKDIQLIQQPYSDTFIPHQSHKTEILLDEPLRRINDKIYDEIVGNKIIRRVGRVKLTKNLTYTHNRNGNNSNEVVTCFGLRIEDKSLEGSETTVIKCNMLQQGSLGTEEEYWWAYKDAVFYFSIYNHKLKSLDVNGLKDYVDKNHLEFLYVLNEPIIEELPNGITLQGFDDTTMYIENSITPTVSYGYNALIPYKNELLHQKEDVEINTLDIENNIIPYLMDMEFSLMLMGDK